MATSREEKLTPRGSKASAASKSAKPAKNGVTVAGGTWGLTAQQLAFVVSQGMLMCEQQLCVACCVGSTHAPTDSSNTPIREIAIAARWPIPCNIESGYHVWEIWL